MPANERKLVRYIVVLCLIASAAVGLVIGELSNAR